MHYILGNLKMEKSVGAHLRNIDRSIARAYTVRDTTTHYLIKTKLGKREIILEERPASTAVQDLNLGLTSRVQSSGTYRLSVFEDGQEIGRHEADINVPESTVN